jgi:hypothetical protein
LIIVDSFLGRGRRRFGPSIFDLRSSGADASANIAAAADNMRSSVERGAPLAGFRLPPRRLDPSASAER